jgi:hypothetical protein
MSSENILLVEGESDRGFFEALCKQQKIKAKVQTPKNFNASHNGKQQVLQWLTERLFLSTTDNKNKCFGVVVDADYPLANGLGGHQKTLDGFSSKLAEFGYKSNPTPTPGLIFSHDAGLADIGLWIMPNNADDGMLEDWIKTCIHSNEQELLDHVNQSIDRIPDGKCKFEKYHKTKAEVATWLAWQKKPGHGLYNAINQQDLLNSNSDNFKNLVNWLQNVFNK